MCSITVRTIIVMLSCLFTVSNSEAERRANEFVNRMKETVLLEREEILSQMITVQELQQQVGASISAETQKELQRLRDELIKARRIETRKDREVSFLQRQLAEAAKRIAELSFREEQAQAMHPDGSNQAPEAAAVPPVAHHE